METKKRRTKRTPESYKREVSEITNGEYSVLGEYSNLASKIFHLHNECGHEWEAIPNNFIYNGTRCPKCAKRARRTPEEFREEVEEKTSGEYSVLGDFVNVRTKMDFVHNVCGTVWEKLPDTFNYSGIMCPKCPSNRTYKVSRTPEDYYKEVSGITDGEYSVLEDFINMSSKIPHAHLECGHVWEITPSGFVSQGTRCPKCSAIRKTNDQFVAEVFSLVGDEYTFLDPYVNYITNLRVRHNTCGHVWKLQPSSFTSKSTRCPNCIYSRGEKAVADVLDSLSIEYIREHLFDYLGLKRYDFFIPSLNIAIEYDGVQHFEAIEFWGGDDRLKETQESDAIKNDFCEYMGIDLLRIPHWEYHNVGELVSEFVSTSKAVNDILYFSPQLKMS